MSGRPSHKKSTTERVAELIAAQIVNDGWRDLIPSGRDLARQHQVSLPTIQKAIALLVERRVLLSRGDKRRHAVSPDHQAAPAGPENRQVLVVTSAPLSTYDATIALGIRQLEATLREHGHAFRLLDVSEVAPSGRRKAVRTECHRFRPTHCVLMKPDAEILSGVPRGELKIATMFSKLKTRGLFALGVRYGYLTDIAVGRLKALGHRRFFIPLLGRHTKMRSSIQGIAHAAKSHGVDVKVRLSPEACSPENMAAALRQALASGVTAILFPQWVDFLPSIAFFAKQGIEFPRDLSVVAMVGCAQSVQYAPSIAGCLNSPESIARQTFLWVDSGKIEDAAYSDVYAQTWQDGGSIGPAPIEG